MGKEKIFKEEKLPVDDLANVNRYNDLSEVDKIYEVSEAEKKLPKGRLGAILNQIILK